MPDTTTGPQELTTEATEPQEGAQQPEGDPQGRQGIDDAQGQPDGDEEPESGNREAAKYRRRLRDTEAEREALGNQLAAAHRQIAEQIATGPGRIKPEGLWASGVTVADLLAEDGTVDPDKVLAACDTAAAALGLSRRPKAVPSEGRNPGVPHRDDMAAAIRG